MTMALGIVGAGQFAGQFASLFQLHPGIGPVFVTDVRPERSAELCHRLGLAGTFHHAA